MFTQFISTGKVLGYMLGLANVKFLYYYGSMSKGQKDRALKTFKTDLNVQVLVSKTE